MKNYLWVIIAGICAFVLFIIFIMTIAKSTKLVSKLRYSKSKLLLNFCLFIGGVVDIGLVIYLLLSVREQIEMFNSL